ncbi:hypothetical protein DFJ58DRAFT_808240 [Suillus subalutaceus]|uniref:uncharacterized protein n=1 Tax=Suillus subalutaceus TaxID=48586 RepID=UPI001B8752C5|nr:uncharacterized protein DFJ58DRAFT_808240 [Suillus subalutaceus]KAG1841551.1 hypothetical protein DFJ58DRAFT_808240 [Suillus subalutaceus]
MPQLSFRCSHDLRSTLAYLARQCPNCHSLSQNSQPPTMTGPPAINSNSALPRRLSSAASSASGSPLTAMMKTTVSRTSLPLLSTSLVHSGAVNGKRPKTKVPTSLLDIPSKPSPDWRKATQKRRAGAARFILDSAKASTSADGSVGELDTRDTLDSGPQLSGIHMMAEEHAYAKVEETEDQKAPLLAGDMDSAPQIDSIPVPPNETDAIQQDVADLPDVVTIDDYARVPIIAFPAYSPAAQSFPALVVSIL